MPLPDKLLDLLSRFDTHVEEYKSGRYNETQVRREYIDPLFNLLGWDIENREGNAEAYKDVVHEDAIKIGSAIKAPDYSFRIGGKRIFFLEAKKPSVFIKGDPGPAYQLRRYAWSAKLPISILTDFEEFAIYDCRVKPKASDKPSVARIFYCTYREYADKWDEISGIFSKEAVKKGSFDKFAGASKGKRGTGEVDSAFLSEIEGWRAELAKNLALRNPKLSQRELNFSVQRIIDRVIFLRICEDRGIEKYGRLGDICEKPGIYAELLKLFNHADDRYNSGIFHFKQEKNRGEAPDELTPRLKIDDKVLKNILGHLYYPESPYEFSVLSADILGQVYEQFLGKVIRLTSGHSAKVEDKPEVKKAGGVYYTPTYIVDYIVKNTVGELLKGRNPKSAAKLRVLDPACGSGSFLLGAYQFLLDWHLEQYTQNPSQHKKEIRKTAQDQWRLTVEEKKRILLNNIYGVDIDFQAVEVSKLSLLLKVLEDESSESVSAVLFHKERALPDLGQNIKCGNSLIGPDFYQQQQKTLLDLDEEEKQLVNAFDWFGKDGFPDIMKLGGFDAVIGNPPYVRIQAMKEWAPLEVEFYKKRYKSASKGNYDIYVVFVEKGLSLLNRMGKLGFILPHKFFNAQYGEPLRMIIAKGKHLSHVVHFGDQQIFSGATTYTCLMLLNKSEVKNLQFLKVTDLSEWRNNGKSIEGKIPTTNISASDWNFAVGKGADLLNKLRCCQHTLGDIADRIAQGIRTSANEVYVLDIKKANKKTLLAYSNILNEDVVIETATTLPFLQGREIKPYKVMPSGKVVIIPYLTKGTHSTLISEEKYKQEYPYTYEYLLRNKKYLADRENGRMQGPNWFGYIYPKNIDLMRNAKILVPDIADRASFALDSNGNFSFTSGYGIILKSNFQFSLMYVLGLLNSKLLDFFLKKISTTMRGGFFRYFTQYIEQLPIRVIDFSNKADKAKHERMVALVEEMLSLHKKLPEQKTPQEKTATQRQIDATDQAIDALVYDLYGLTEEEIAIIEGGE